MSQIRPKRETCDHLVAGVYLAGGGTGLMGEHGIITGVAGAEILVSISIHGISGAVLMCHFRPEGITNRDMC